MADLSKPPLDPFAPPGGEPATAGQPAFAPPPASQYAAPGYGQPPPQYGSPPPTYGSPPSQYGSPPSQYGSPLSFHGAPPPQYGAPAGYGSPPGHGGYGPPLHAGGYGPQPAWSGQQPPDPAGLLMRAARTLQVGAGLLWALLLGWVLFLVAGIAYANVPEARSSPGTDDADALMGLGLLLYLGLGVAVWALVAVWTSEVARACRAAGNGHPDRSSWAWWGLFVPLAGLVLPLLAYRQAAAYVESGRRVGGAGSGRGSWWLAEPVPALLGWWWTLWALAAVAMLVGLGAAEDAFGVAAAAFTLTGVAGAASSVCGAVVLRRLAQATAACAGAYRG